MIESNSEHNERINDTTNKAITLICWLFTLIVGTVGFFTSMKQTGNLEDIFAFDIFTIAHFLLYLSFVLLFVNLLKCGKFKSILISNLISVGWEIFEFSFRNVFFRYFAESWNNVITDIVVGFLGSIVALKLIIKENEDII